MEFKLTHPCSDCPFRKDRYFYLDKKRKEDIASELLFGDKTFSCHKTVDYSNSQWDEEGVEYTHTGKEQHCAGALIILHRMGSLWDNFMLRLAYTANLFNPNKLDFLFPVYNSMQEWIDAKPDGNKKDD